MLSYFVVYPSLDSTLCTHWCLWFPVALKQHSYVALKGFCEMNELIYSRYFIYTALSTRARATQLQQIEPAPPPPSQQSAQLTQAQTQQQIQNGTLFFFIFKEHFCSFISYAGQLNEI